VEFGDRHRIGLVAFVLPLKMAVPLPVHGYAEKNCELECAQGGRMERSSVTGTEP
jgi:hypothetical protein